MKRTGPDESAEPFAGEKAAAVEQERILAESRRRAMEDRARTLRALAGVRDFRAEWPVSPRRRAAPASGRVSESRGRLPGDRLRVPRLVGAAPVLGRPDRGSPRPRAQSRAAEARLRFPSADLRIGDATRLPWPNGRFPLVIASTVFSSILDPVVRRMVASEINRVLAPGGALLWYDLRVNNAANPHVRKVGRPELLRLFPGLKGEIRSVTLAPPVGRAVIPASWLLAELLEMIPVLRTHLLAVMVKGET